MVVLNCVIVRHTQENKTEKLRGFNILLPLDEVGNHDTLVFFLFHGESTKKTKKQDGAYECFSDIQTMEQVVIQQGQSGRPTRD